MTAAFDSNLMTTDSAGEWPFLYQAVVARVVDADTLVLEVDLGFALTHTLKVRLLGIDAPELATEAGKLSRDYVLAWLEQHGSRVRVQTKKDRADSFGRYLAWISVNGVSLNEALLSAGHAKEYRTNGK